MDPDHWGMVRRPMLRQLAAGPNLLVVETEAHSRDSEDSPAGPGRNGIGVVGFSSLLDEVPLGIGQAERYRARLALARIDLGATAPPRDR